MVLVCLLSINRGTAQPVLGADITWKCVGQDSFLIKLDVFTDCAGLNQNLSPIYFKCNSIPGTNITQLNISPGTSVDITPVCSTFCLKCTNPGCPVLFGIKKFSIQGLVKLNNAGSCCQIVLSWSGYRQPTITTGAASGQLYCEAILNRCLNPCDNSPVFTNSPVILLCKGQDFSYNHGAIDKDVNAEGGLADSLAYHWTAPLWKAGSVIPYNGTFSYDKPITFYGYPQDTLALPRGLHLDHNTGDIKFRPMKTEVTVMVVKVDEFRNGVKIGEIRRDLTVFVINCNANSPPALSTPNNIKTKHVCPGDTVTFSFSTSDPNSNDYTTISWNNTITGAVWWNNNGQIQHPSATLRWIPEKSQGSSLPYTFTVTVKDNACPLSAQYTETYRIFVNPVPENITITDSGCGTYYFKTPHVTGIVPRYTWSSDSFAFSPDTGYMVSHNFLPGHYQVKLDMMLPACSRNFSKNFHVDSFLSVQLPNDTVVCKNSSITIRAGILNYAGPFSVQWGSGNISFPGDTGIIKKITVTKDTTIRVRATYGSFSCPFDEMRIRVHANKISLPDDSYFCGLNNIVSPEFSTSKDAFSSFRWYHDFSPSEVGFNAKISISDTGYYQCVATDTSGCIYTANTIVHLNPKVIAGASDTLICRGANTSIRADLIPDHNYTYQWWLNDSLLSESRVLTVHPKYKTRYTLLATELLNGVECSDSHQVTVFTKGNISFDDLGFGCSGGKQIHLDSFVRVNNKRVTSGIWACPDDPSQVGANIFFTQTAYVNLNPGYRLTFTYFDSLTSCLLYDVLFLKIYPKPATPKIIVAGDTLFCYGSSTTLSAAASSAHYLWLTNETGKNIKVHLSGIYRLSVGNIFGCYSDFSKAVGIFVYPKPVTPAISLTPSDSFLETNIVSGYYEWYYKTEPSGNPIKIANNADRIYPRMYCKKCYFSVFYYDTNDCASDTSAPYYFCTNQTEQIKQNSAFLIYPNPAHSRLFIENPTQKSSDLIFVNVLGNIHLQITIIPGKTELSLTNYKPGIYFIFMDGRIAGKIIIE
jgi:hypothetical protein